MHFFCGALLLGFHLMNTSNVNLFRCLKVKVLFFLCSFSLMFKEQKNSSIDLAYLLGNCVEIKQPLKAKEDSWQIPGQKLNRILIFSKFVTMAFQSAALMTSVNVKLPEIWKWKWGFTDYWDKQLMLQWWVFFLWSRRTCWCRASVTNKGL